MSDTGSDVWMQLRRFTPARIGLGRVGGSLPTRALVEFELAHAQARDAVHAALDPDALAQELQKQGFGWPILVRSEASDRMEYLLRPDRGRALNATSREGLQQFVPGRRGCELAVVIADGLSAQAPARHAASLLREMRALSDLLGEGTVFILATLARVALGDQIGELLQAKAVLVLIGERPGLSSPDSLGAYLTWAPRVGRTDAERNCVSNIRPEGLSYPEAARKLLYLLGEAQRLQLSGIQLKDDSESLPARLP